MLAYTYLFILKLSTGHLEYNSADHNSNLLLKKKKKTVCCSMGVIYKLLRRL